MDTSSGAQSVELEPRFTVTGRLSAEHTTPVIEPEENAGSEAAQPIRETPLPRLQLSVLLCIQLAEPITASVIYPFVNQLVRQTGITGGNDEKTGYFAGLVESAFYAVEAVCVLQWGRLSDRIGRKPVMLGGLLGLTLSMIGFGVSRQYWALILSRCVEGALNGNVGVTKSMMAEITDATNRDRGFSYLPMIWSLGTTIGPTLGGVLASPAGRWPAAFAYSAFWTKFPYFLPCIVAACFSMTAFLLAFSGLEETLKRSRKPSTHFHSDAGPPYQPPAIEQQITAEAGPSDVELTTAQADAHSQHRQNTEGEHPVMAQNVSPGQEPLKASLRSILIPRIMIPISNYGFLAFVDQSYTVLLPLMYSSPISEGGLGFSSLTIGVIQGVAGVIGGVITIFTFAWIHRKFGTKRLYIVSFACYLVGICCFPALSAVTKRAGQVNSRTWVLIVLQAVSYFGTHMTWGCIFMYISDGAPNQASLGLTNGLAQTTASTVRALAPSTASSLFSVSLQYGLAGGTLVYWILCAFILGGIVASMWLPRKLLV